ncbi:class I SAM-dependent methyltransferase [Candidatus Pacearchaeota archaeon]|nr:class I SAM-dependent methyltransferase [Candidatus Pacearchaeota archaeon]
MEALGHKFENCQVCNSSKLYKFLSLGHHPNPDGFLSKEQLGEPEIYYPLDLFFCEDCKLVQLGYAPDPSALFNEGFIYTTGSSKELIDNFHSLAETLVKKFNLSSKDLVIDIGSNDGTFLGNFLPHKIKILGIDPSKAANLAIEKNIPTLKDFFNEKTAQRVLNERGKAKIITAANVFAHVHDLDSFMNGVKLLLDDKGAFVQESGYIKTLIEHTQYDSIYVEHLRYYSLKSLINLFNKFGMEVFDAEEITTHGGSIRTYSCKKGAFPISENIQKILKKEEEYGLNSNKLFDGFGEKVESNRSELRKILFDFKSQGKKIVGLGAPAKGNTLLNFCKIGNETVDALLERGSLKVGMYSPGAHIPILEEEILFGNNQPDCALLLSWNLKDIIVPKVRAKGFNGKIIVPVPKPHVLQLFL